MDPVKCCQRQWLFSELKHGVGKERCQIKLQIRVKTGQGQQCRMQKSIVLVRFQACPGFADWSQGALRSHEMQELDEQADEKYMVLTIPVRKYCSTIHHAQTAESTQKEFLLSAGQDLHYCSVATSARGAGHGANRNV